MQSRRILVSGGGIAGLTLAIQLKQSGFEPLVVERESSLRREGYMMDFFGTGWDVAERMGLVDELRSVRYPIDALEFVDRAGKPYVHMPIARLREALDNNYVYLRRPDLERILAERARGEGIELRYGGSIAALQDVGDRVQVRFEDGGEEDFALVVGADGIHSRVRELVFGPKRQFARFLGLYVAAFHAPSGDFSIGHMVKLYEEVDHSAFLYPLSDTQLDATLIFRHDQAAVPPDTRITFLRAQFERSGWITQDVLRAYTGGEPIYFDDATQIVMPQWHRGRVALVGDACGCLTLLAGQGSHMAMAGGYVLARELARHSTHEAAFAAYQAVLKRHVDRRQKDAARFAGLFPPSARSRPWLRRLTLQLMFSAPVLRLSLIHI